MKLPQELVRAAYAIASPGALAFAPFLPSKLNSGKRAAQGRRESLFEPEQRGSTFVGRVLASRWRSKLLTRAVCGLDPDSLAKFITQRVSIDSVAPLEDVIGSNRPLVICAPHYGACLVGLLAAINLFRGHKEVFLFYDRERQDSRLRQLFLRAGMSESMLLGGFAGIVTALRALDRGQALIMLPDVFDDVSNTIVVPFFGRLLRVAPGTAALALRSRALIVPVFPAPDVRFGVRLAVGQPIDSATFAERDRRQAIFALSCWIFREIEQRLRRTPEHWHYWDMLPRVSTCLARPLYRDAGSVQSALESKCQTSPRLMQLVPELAGVCHADHRQQATPRRAVRQPQGMRCELST